MDVGHCPRCGTAFSVGEVTGYGILRARPAAAGGPLMEYECQGCQRTLKLVPHGEGRYAFPGQPPPPAPPEEARRPAWFSDQGPTNQGDANQGADAEGPARAGAAGSAHATDRRRREEPTPAEPPDPGRRLEIEPAPVDLAEALSILGVEPGVSRLEMEEAFRERSLTCHPDKVAHLDIDFQTLANRKFLRLRVAYDVAREALQ